MAIFFLRTKENISLIEASEIVSEEWECDFSTLVYVKNLCNYVVNWDQEIHQREEFIQDIDDLSELRGEFFETDIHKKESTWDFLSRRFNEIAKKWELCVVTD